MITNYNLDNLKRVELVSNEDDSLKGSESKRRGRPKGSPNKPKISKNDKGSTKNTKKVGKLSEETTKRRVQKRKKKSDEEEYRVPTYEEKVAYCNEKYGEGKWYFMDKEEFKQSFMEYQERRRLMEEENNGYK